MVKLRINAHLIGDFETWDKARLAMESNRRGPHSRLATLTDGVKMELYRLEPQQRDDSTIEWNWVTFLGEASRCR